MSLNSIEHEWRGYADMVIPKDASAVQIDETKQAFFAGAWALFNAIEEIGEPHISEAQGETYLTDRKAEMLAFKDRLIAKYAERNQITLPLP